jgi:hypothetical protein
VADGIWPIRWLIFPAILCASTLLSCGGEASRDKASVEVRDGVRIVKNPVEPASAQTPPSLREELIIGAGGEPQEPILFQDITYYSSIDVDASGNIYIADAGAKAIIIVDSGGRRVRTIGREGQGPGEFQSLSALRILPGEKLAVYDRTNRRLSLFDLDGRLSGELSLAAHPALFAPQIDSRGNIFGLELTMNGSVRTMVLLKISSDGTASARMACSTRRLSLDGSIKLFATRLDFRLTPLDEIVWGNQRDYVLNILDQEGRPKAVIKKACAPVAVTGQDVEAELSRRGTRRLEGEKVSAPAQVPSFSMLLIADDGRIFAQVRERTVQGIRFAYDVFDGQGVYLFRMRLPGTPLLIKAARLYTLEENGEGAILIKRYMMK